MGILNVTPDSFFDGFRYTDESAVVKQTEKMIREGADIIDVGGYSSRPGAEHIPAEEELKRVIPAVKAIRKNFPDIVISIDTFRAEVAEKAVESGAAMVNDISGGQLDQAMFATVARLNVAYILMHLRGTPQTMNSLTQYDHLLKEIIDYFHQKIFTLQQLGVRDLLIDPGFGFAKTVEQNFELLQNLDALRVLGKPVLAGLSRKSMIWRTLATTPENALNGTTALNAVALMKGAALLRVHDVREAKETITLLRHLNPSL